MKALEDSLSHEISSSAFCCQSTYFQLLRQFYRAFSECWKRNRFPIISVGHSLAVRDTECQMCMALCFAGYIVYIVAGGDR